MADDEGGMRIVSSKSDREIEAERRRQVEERARDDLIWPFRHLAANLLRVIRGAGRSAELGRQMVEVIEAYESYRAAVGAYPSDYDIHQALGMNAISEDERHRWNDRSFAIDTIASGSLQRIASQMVQQNTQRIAGEREMMEGVNQIVRIRDQQRRVDRPAPTPEAVVEALVRAKSVLGKSAAKSPAKARPKRSK